MTTTATPAATTDRTATPPPNLHEDAADVAAALAARDWVQREDVTEDDGRLLERAWTSPDGTRAVSWFPADDFDLGGWMITRPGPDTRCAETHLGQHTRACVITALALTD